MEKSLIYLDYNTTCPLDPGHIQTVAQVLTHVIGNPTSEHTGGDGARTAMDESRGHIARWLGAEKSEIIFCSGATEANNLALSGVVEELNDVNSFKPRIILTAGEHVSLRKPAQKWVDSGRAELQYVRLKEDGQVDQSHLRELTNERTVFAGIIHVNNETGVVSNLSAIAEIIRDQAPNCHIHSDGVQAIGKVATQWIGQGLIDSYAISSHKIGGFGGVGALYLNHRKTLHPLILGGSQEQGRRAGTENIAGIISLGLRAKEILAQPHWLGQAEGLGNRLKQAIKDIPGIFLHGENTLPTCLNFHLEGVSLETLLDNFRRNGICVAAGAAFSATFKKPSETLLAMGYSRWIAGNSIRVSLGRNSRAADTAELLETLRAKKKNFLDQH